jgi:hypothetical protein
MPQEQKEGLLKSNLPIIIGGCGRSGTTLMLSILSAHPNIFSIPFETKVFSPRGTNNTIDCNKEIDTTFLFQYLMHSGVFNAGLKWCEKTPKNIYYFQQIDDYFSGNFKFINMLRDGRDVVTSRHPCYPNEYWVSPERWLKDVNEGFKYKGHPNFITVKYEDLILDFDVTIRKIITFLEVDFNPALLEWYKHNKIKKANSIDGHIVELYKTSIGKWRNDEHEQVISKFLSSVEAISTMKNSGYM